jgi:hypothetical protein
MLNRVRRPSLLLGLTALAALLVSAASGAPGTGPITTQAGTPLRLANQDQPVMQVITAPARVTRVAVVPGSAQHEAWGVGFTRSPGAGFERFNSNQTVFLRYTPATGWVVIGAPKRSDGSVTNPIVNAIALAPNGEGWAATRSGQFFHRLPASNEWILDAAASALTTNAIDSISLGQDGQGVYGFASGAGLTFLALTGTAWATDGGSGGRVPLGSVPEMVAVAAVNRSAAWAVSGTNSSSLQIYQRTGPQLWTRVLTGDNVFDAPPALAGSAQSQTINQSAHGNGVAVADGVVWVSGALSPVNAAQPLANDRTQPFVLRLVPGATTPQVVSYCPRLYQLSTSGATSTVDVCDEPFPSANGDDLPVLQAFHDGSVLAGGLGLYRFESGGSHGHWVRQPNDAGYLVSGSFESPTEGWVNSDGVTHPGSRGGFDANTTALGHWTRQPEASALRRWPQAGRQAYEAVAIDPGNPAVALAVGQAGAVARQEPGIGWDVMSPASAAALHAIAWPAHGRAWAVGGSGTIVSYDGTRWSADPASGSVTKKSLYGLAFRSPADGFAVGAGGTILHYDGKAWSADPASGKVTTKRLNGMTVAGADVVAVGEKATVLTNTAGAWKAVTGFENALKIDTDNHLPNLISAAGLPDGSAYLGGSEGTLLERAPSGTVTPARWPLLEGDIHTLAATKSGGQTQLVALVGTKTNRLGTDELTEPYGWVMVGTPAGWRDVRLDRARSLFPTTDTAVLRDPAYGLALDPTGRTGWVVGGQAAVYSDEDGHTRFAPTSSVWRFDLGRHPQAAPAEAAVNSIPVPAGTSFAFLGGSACGGASCSALLGAASRGDAVLADAMQAIRREVDAGVVKFVGYGGNARVNGLPDELSPLRGLYDDVGVPVYSALGDRDLFGTAISGPTTQNGVVTSNGYVLQTFADRPAPWGGGSLPKGFRAVSASSGAPGQAHTHYAVDYMPAGKALVRLVVLDTSYGSLTASDPFQNPAGETQLAWLQTMLADALVQGVPSIVMLNSPIVLPADSSSVDTPSLTTALTVGGASGVLASHTGVNQIINSPSDAAPVFPIGISGTAGSALANAFQPTQGGYYAWMLVTVESAKANLTGKAPVSIQTIPVLESLALHPKDGRTVGAGSVLHFDALGRAPDVGGSNSDGGAVLVAEGNATYLSFPFPRQCGALEQPSPANCRPANTAVPQYRFVSEDANVGQFVAEDPAHPGQPLIVDGHPVADEHSGLFCAVNPGTTSVRVESGLVASRLPVTVGGGGGPCRVGIAAPPPPPVLAPVHLDEPAPGTIVHDPVHTTPPKPRITGGAAVGVAVPPLPSASLATPGGGAGQREEEREAAHENAEARALPRARNAVARHSDNTRPTALTNLFAMAAGTVVLAFLAGYAARPRPKPAYQEARNIP